MLLRNGMSVHGPTRSLTLSSSKVCPALFALSSPTSSSPALPSGKRLFDQNPNRI
jgi:hypothetical protein